MEQINIVQVEQLVDSVHRLKPVKCHMVDQDTGESRTLNVHKVLEDIRKIRAPVFRTDENGVRELVTLDIYYDYTDADLRTGKVVRIFYERSPLQKRIQPASFSNGVGAPTSDDGLYSDAY